MARTTAFEPTFSRKRGGYGSTTSALSLMNVLFTKETVTSTSPPSAIRFVYALLTSRRSSAFVLICSTSFET